MSDYILKQNAGRGGAVIVAAAGTLPAGEYVAMAALGSGASMSYGAGITFPLISSGTITALPAGMTVNTVIVSTGASNTVTATGGPFIFYKGVTI
jgi:hypothetical protein